MSSYKRSPISPLLERAANAPILSPEHEHTLVLAAVAGDKRALERIVSSHLRLVISIARKFERFGFTMDDLMSVGLIGFMEGVKRYDPHRGQRIAVYASHWIKAYIRRHTIEQRRIVRMPQSRGNRKVIASLRRVQGELTHQLGRPPTTEEIAATLGVKIHEVEDIETSFTTGDAPLGNDATLGGYRQIHARTQNPEEILADKEHAGRINHAASVLPELLNGRQLFIVHERLMTDEPASYAQLSEVLGVSRQRCQQIAVDSLAIMRKTARRQRIDVSDDVKAYSRHGRLRYP